MMPPVSSWAKSSALLLACTLFGTQASARDDHYSQLLPCPVSCDSTKSPAQWTLYNSVARLSVCNEPTIFEVSLSAPIESSDQITRVRACTAGNATSLVNAITGDEPEVSVQAGRIARRAEKDTCRDSEKQASPVKLATWGERKSGSAQDAAVQSLDKLREWIEKKSDCTSSTFLGHYNGAFVGYHGGALVDHKAIANGLIKDFADDIKESGIPDRIVVQHCGETGGNNLTIGGVNTAGVVVSSDGKFGPVQAALNAWKEAECLKGNSNDVWSDFELSFHPANQGESLLQERQSDGECRTIRVDQGNGCPDLAKRCGISGADFTKYNPGKDHCSSLRAGQPVCCSSGELPDFAPKPDEDGNCFEHTTTSVDTCSGLAAQHTLDEDDIFEFNEDTWGWSGCDPLPLGISMCLSKGKPPMPAPVDNAECGPTKPGSEPPEDDETLSDLNPCPLNVCCNIWGQCGTIADYCTEEDSETGAPGTSGHPNGCVQNCGMDIVNDDEAPETFRTLTYFEAWNFDRDCLHMDVRATKEEHWGWIEPYTDIHFAFGEISDGDYEVVIPDNQKDQWDVFLDMQDGPRKILAFGGWAFSAEPATYHIFRDVMQDAHRDAFAQKCVDFAIENKLDGLDFDWEYPGAPGKSQEETGALHVSQSFR